MTLCRSILVYVPLGNTRVGARVGAKETADVEVLVLLLLVGASLVNSSLLTSR